MPFKLHWAGEISRSQMPSEVSNSLLAWLLLYWDRGLMGMRRGWDRGVWGKRGREMGSVEWQIGENKKRYYFHMNLAFGEGQQRTIFH